MKKQFFAILISVFFVNALFAVVVTESVTRSDFDLVKSDADWLVQYQSGGDGGCAGSYELRIATPSDSEYYTADTNWINETSNPFTVSIDASGFLSATVNSTTTPSGSQPGITNPFNEIWIGLNLNTGDDRDFLSVNSHEYNGDPINDLSLSDGTTDAWASFKLWDDQNVDNIGDFTVSGNLFPDMIEGSATGGVQGWTYTIFGTYNSAIPESSSVTLIMGTLVFCCSFVRRRSR